MANGVITGDEVLRGVRERIQEVDSDFKKLLNTYNDLGNQLKNTTTVTGIETSIKNTNKANKEQVALLTQLARLKKEEANAEKAVTLAKKASATAQKSSNAATRTNLSQFNSLNNAYQQQSRLLNSLRDRYKALGIQQLQSNNLSKAQVREYRRLGSQIKVLDGQLKKVDATAGQFQRNVGNYPKTLGAATRGIRSFAGAFGFTSGIFLFASALKQTVGVFKQFDQGQADLAAILGRNKNEIKELTQQAKQLGATTAFTATQVSELQLELAKLGFNDKEILSAAEGIENLAIATGVDAARAAKLAGAALRGFNLDASEANRVASVLAVSTTKSASSFETLETALPKVSAIAKSFGFTIEDTTALLGGLQNAGFEASIAGTSLRQIFLQLADSNGKLAQRLGGGAKNFDQLIEQFKKLEGEGISLGEAFNLTNARSVAAFKVFLQGADDLKVLRDGIVDVEDELTQLATTKLDSLTGDVTLLNSAFEGLVLSIEDGRGAISLFFRDAVQGLTDFLTGLRDANIGATEQGVLAARSVVEDFKKSTEIIAGETKEFLISTIQDADANISVLQERVNELRDSGKIGELFTRNYFDKLEEAERALEKEKASRGELTQILLQEGRSKDDLAERTAKLAVLVAAEKGNEIDLTKQILYFQGLTVEQLEELNKEYALYLKGTQEQVSTGKENVKIIEGSIAAYKELIAELTKTRDATATTTEEFQKFDDQIAQTERKIRRLKEGLDSLNKVQGSTSGVGQNLNLGLQTGDVSDQIETDSPELAGIQLSQNLIDQKEKERVTIKAIQDGKISDLEAFTKEEARALQEGFRLQEDLQRDFENAKIDLVLGGVDSIFQARVDSIDREIQANQSKLDTILNSTTSSDEQKLLAQEAFDKQQKKLEKEKEKREKQAFLIRQGIALAEIAINLARTLAAINAAAVLMDVAFPFLFGAAGVAYRGANIPLAIGTSATQAGLVIAQTIPQFFKGKKATDNFEGFGTVGEKRKEVIIGGDGSIEVTPNKTTPRFINRDDIIVPSISQFDREIKNPDSDVSKRLSSNISRDTEERKRMIVINQKTDTRGIEKAIERALSKHKPSPVYVKNIVESKYSEY
jgi:TP901 family phage tail tape measure protein